MGRQSTDPTMVGSSIALLQERFRQLQRVREKREEQELLKMLSQPKQVTPNKLSFQPNMIFPLSPPPPQDAPCLGLDSSSKPADFRSIEAGSLTTLWSTDATIMSISYCIDNSEVDTSLHL